VHPACNDPLFPGVICDSPAKAGKTSLETAQSTATAQIHAAKAKKNSPHRIGRFFRKLFGRS